MPNAEFKLQSPACKSGALPCNCLMYQADLQFWQSHNSLPSAVKNHKCSRSVLPTMFHLSC